MRIRRPLYFIAAACTAAVLIKYYFGWPAAAGVGAGLGAILLWQLNGDSKRCKQSVDRPVDRFRGRPNNRNRRLVITMLLIAYAVSLLNCCSCDRRLSADPILDVLDQEVTIIGIVKAPEITTDSKGKLMLRIETEVRSIDNSEVRPGRLLLSVPAEAAAGKSAEQGSFQESGQSAGQSGSDNEASSGGEADPLDPVLICRAMTAVPPGSVIRFTGTPKRPDPKRNPNCFDYRLYLKTKGIQSTMRAEHIQVLSQGRRDPGHSTEETSKPTAGGRLFLLREHYLARVGAHAGAGTESMIRAILFGEKGMLDDEIQEIFQKNGTAHVLAVSGLHVGMIYGSLTVIWDLLAKCFPAILGARKGRRFFICTALFFSGYAFLAGFSPSVVRAVCMVLLHAFASMTGRRYDLSCAAFAVGIAALLHNPYILFQAGFQMSFLAILILGLITPYIRRVYSGALVGSIAIQIGLGPYMAYQFNVLPLLAVLINVPAIFLTGILVPAGLLAMMLPNTLPVIPGICDQTLASLCAMLVRLNELCDAGHMTSLTCASPPIGLLAAYYLGLLVFASEEGRLLFLRHQKGILQKLAAGVLIASLLFGQAADDGFRHAQMVFVDVGQGDCMHIRSGRADFLIDGGGSKDYEVGTKTLKPYLLKNGVSRIDGAFVSHLHTDHYQGICELAKAGMVRRLFLYDGNRVKEAQVCEETGLEPSQLTYLRQGQKVELPGGGSVEVLWPKEKSTSEYERMVANEEDENASSLILKVTVGGVSMLATGDLGEEGEADLLREYGPGAGTGGAAEAGPSRSTISRLHVDVLKVGHHGSKTSSCDAFLDAAAPKTAVIQVGAHNMYGHPTPETLGRLAERQIPVYRNDLQGAVGMQLKNGRIRKVMTMIREDAEAGRPSLADADPAK